VRKVNSPIYDIMGRVQLLFGECESQVFMRRKTNLSAFVGQFFHVDFEQQERRWVLGQSNNHVVFENNHERATFCAKSKVVCMYLIFHAEEMVQEP
jgi:hypothetical protein